MRLSFWDIAAEVKPLIAFTGLFTFLVGLFVWAVFFPGRRPKDDDQ